MATMLNRKDVEFQLFDVLDATSLSSAPRYSDHDRETYLQMLDTAEQLAEDKFLNHAAAVDANEPHFDGEKVHIIPEVKAGIDAFIDAGFMGSTFDYKDGGLQLPNTVFQACMSFFNAANVGTSGYPFLTIGNANLQSVYASEEQKQKYMRPMIEGRFFGTMCLSEPQAGSSLSDIRTKAEKQEDGSYHITGTKMWISGGEHELSENIIHLVLAKIPGGPAGVKGISLFIVPKFHVNDDGSLGDRNNVWLGGLNHKMGYRGTTNTYLNFGEKGPCKGWLVGEEHKGLFYMFHMMNEARIGVGLGAAVLGYAGFMSSLDYARERPQGRHPDGKDAGSPQINIIEHADVRRMLLQQKAYAEGSYSLCLYGAMLTDQEKTCTDAEEKARLHQLLDFLTPIIKSWPSEFCLKGNELAIQVLGGAGYTRDYPVERLYRDQRLNPIHEGTHAIHGMDLLGRKVTEKNGASFKLFLAEIEKTAAAAAESENAEIAGHANALRAAVATLVNTTKTVTGDAMTGDITRFLMNATDYLWMAGHVTIAWNWLGQAMAAQAKIDAGANDDAFLQGKLQTCRFFFRHELPMIHHWAGILDNKEDSAYLMQADWF